MRRPRRLLLLVVAPRRARADRRAIIIVDGPARVGMVVFLLVRSDRRDIPPGRRATDGRGGRDLGLPEGGGGGSARRQSRGRRKWRWWWRRRRCVRQIRRDARGTTRAEGHVPVKSDAPILLRLGDCVLPRRVPSGRRRFFRIGDIIIVGASSRGNRSVVRRIGDMSADDDDDGGGDDNRGSDGGRGIFLPDIRDHAHRHPARVTTLQRSRRRSE